ncbi:MAG: DUF4159 domain-containing protein [Verrucomicrobiales bacterium]|nr:DUF4159 domain-containing protein [Verrucomicrobiales bacterium]
MSLLPGQLVRPPSGSTDPLGTRFPRRPGLRSFGPPPKVTVGVLIFATAVAVFAQRRWRGGWGESIVDERARTAREIESHSTGTPTWTNLAGFEHDVFTFTRVRYEHNGRFGRGGWTTDVPDSDLNLSYRLQQMTSIRVDPDGRLIRPTDPDLHHYPFLYIVEPGALSLDERETLALREYLLNGGFLMLDDFWGENEWGNVEEVMARVLPNRPFRELDLDHEIYKRPFVIRAKGQVPNMRLGIDSQFHGVTAERPDATEVHHRAIFDDHGRLIVLATHNTDNGDGWEREGENDYYFHNFSEKISYPLGINIIFYVMTH